MLNPFSFIIILSGLCLLITGGLMMKFPPGKMNSFYGYRTPRSMRNPETWQEANRYSAKVMFYSGLVECLLGLAGFLVPIPEFTGAISAIVLVLISTFLIIFMTENRLKKRFS
jgi:uncharacterized membrane protein